MAIHQFWVKRNGVYAVHTEIVLRVNYDDPRWSGFDPASYIPYDRWYYSHREDQYYGNRFTEIFPPPQQNGSAEVRFEYLRYRFWRASCSVASDIKNVGLRCGNRAEIESLFEWLLLNEQLGSKRFVGITKKDDVTGGDPPALIQDKQGRRFKSASRVWEGEDLLFLAVRDQPLVSDASLEITSITVDRSDLKPLAASGFRVLDAVTRTSDFAVHADRGPDDGAVLVPVSGEATTRSAIEEIACRELKLPDRPAAEAMLRSGASGVAVCGTPWRDADGVEHVGVLTSEGYVTRPMDYKWPSATRFVALADMSKHHTNTPT